MSSCPDMNLLLNLVEIYLIDIYYVKLKFIALNMLFLDLDNVFVFI